MAEGEGVEPPCPCGTASVFKAATLPLGQPSMAHDPGRCSLPGLAEREVVAESRGLEPHTLRCDIG